jgi:peroxiredoxin
MAQFEPLKNEFHQAGVDVVYIAAEKHDGFHKPSKFLRSHPVSFPFLLDEDRTVTKAYGLYHRIGIDAFHIAHPATLLIDRVGGIRYIYVGGNQFDRAPIEQVLTLARSLPH